MDADARGWDMGQRTGAAHQDRPAGFSRAAPCRTPGPSACIGVHLLCICVKILACLAACRAVPSSRGTPRHDTGSWQCASRCMDLCAPPAPRRFPPCRQHRWVLVVDRCWHAAAPCQLVPNMAMPGAGCEGSRACGAKCTGRGCRVERGARSVTASESGFHRVRTELHKVDFRW
jgi:hypothetical protein